VSYCCPAVVRRGKLTAGGGGLSGVNVADNDHVDVHLLLTEEELASRTADVGRPSRVELQKADGAGTYPMLAVVYFYSWK
jgi:hypothetical protein